MFDGLGKLKDTVVTLHINPDVTPVAQRLRRTPFQMRERVESKLAELVASDIIEPVNGPTPWVNPIIIVPKRDGDIRLIDVNKAQSNSTNTDEYVRFGAINTTPNAMTTKEVERASAEDAELEQLRQCINTDAWGDSPNKLYTAVSAELCVIGELVLRGTRLVIPRELHSRVLTLAHEGHRGIVGTKQALRCKVWWPGIDKDAERYCRTCHGCQLVAQPDPPEPIRSTILSIEPWQDLAVDLLGPLPTGHSILVVIDYYSRFYEYSILLSTTTEKVIECLEEIFTRQSYPMTLKSDNGPQFRSEEFRDYCRLNAIQHLRVTAKWAQANGEVERQNASIMKRIRIAQAGGQDWRKELRKYIYQYRCLPHPTTGKSPAEMNYRRKFRGKLPNYTSDNYIDREVHDRDAEQKGLSRQYADSRRGARYTDVSEGDTVLLRQEKTNKFSTNFNPTPHTVLQKNGNSLVVQSPDGATYSRNSSHVKRYMTTTCEDDAEQLDPVAPSTRVSTPHRPPEADDEVATCDTPTVAQPQLYSPPRRPQRLKQMPTRLADYILQ